jgi:hypothetical protein
MRTCISALVIWIICLGGCGKEVNSPSVNSAAGTGKAGSLARFAIVGDYLYTLDGSDIVCFDISSGNNAVQKNRVKVGFDIETIYPYDNKLFIGSTTGMYAYSLTDPANPQRLSVVTHVRSCDPVVVQGNYAYVTLRSGTNCGGNNVLNVYDVTNLNSPVLKKTINMNSPYGLGVSVNALYVTNPNGIKLFNISQPDNPVAVTDIVESSASDVIPYSNTLIVQLNKGVAFYDISNALSPSFLSRVTQ